ncbi:metallophosphoesterase [Tenacibaculum maritimum]|uniref:metallophosphoesterase n=1 Tax=Tenacibaculum maritimum TaxID=107401 RepID=UPI001E2F7EFD|nr:metallophosphoesterase [Tenacibaculum maritimum]MCD9611885.1 metallophosphoesterase [Tenacibaculum maritimum]
MIRIIHLSDLHLKTEKKEAKEEVFFEKLISDIKTFVNDNTIVIFSGDLVDKFGAEFENKDLKFSFFKEAFIDRLVSLNSKLKNRIFIVPGNHDFDRTKLDDFRDIPFRDTLINNPIIAERYVKDLREKKGVVEGLNEYKIFEKKIYDEAFEGEEYNYTQLDTSFNIKVNNISVGVSCFNSAWLCYENDNLGKLFLTENQISNSLNYIKGASIKIAVMHHPFGFYNDNDFKKVKPLLYNNYQLAFVGHTHKLESSQIDDLDGNLFTSVGKSINGEETDNVNYVCGYSVVDYHLNDKIEVRYRKFAGNNFVINTDIGNDKGLKEFNIPNSEELLCIKRETSIIETIKEEHFNKLNDDLIINIAQANASKLSDVFVKPLLATMPESTLNEKNEIDYISISDLMKDSQHTLVFGVKEIGKTILLNQLLIEFTEKYDNYGYIPILIKFNQISNKELIKIIKEFILKNASETNDIISKSNIVLLIDDIDFSDDYKYQLKSLKKFVDDNSNVRIIATHNISDEEPYPLKTIESFSKLTENFQTLYLHFFKSKQIKQLISNWVDSSDIDLHQNIEKLIKAFNELGLPKTPLAVTLFLSIINKQERKPINNAVLVEMFIEKLLEKQSVKNLYFDTFNFADKQRLLAHIAKYMLDNGGKNFSYQVNEISLLKEIENYLTLKIDINPTKLFNYFIDRGVFVRSNGASVRFKTSFFFSYFLAKHMEHNNEFKSKVFTKSNYHNYINEIDFYTGLNREDDTVFSFVVNELVEGFNFINKKVREDYEIIDEILETNDMEDTISSKLDLDSITKNRPSEQAIEEAYDSRINAIKNNQKISPKEDVNLPTEEDDGAEQDSPNLSRILKVASVTLKNSVDIDPNKRKDAYDEVLLSSISFMMIYRDAMLYYHSEKGEDVSKYLPKKMSFSFFMKLLPMIHQVTLYNWLGSLKLAPIIRKKILEDRDTENITELEKFLSVYIYSDIRGKNHPEFIDFQVKNSKRRYILDNSFVKNMSYYYLRSKSAESDKIYTGRLAEIKLKLNEVSKHNKASFIQKLEKKKLGNRK